MFRKSMFVIVATLTAVLAGQPAIAQDYYENPQWSYGYWGPWMWAGSTIEGDTGRGDGFRLMGAGYFIYQQARAEAIAWETYRRQNEYLAMVQQEQARRYTQRQRADRQAHDEYRKQTEDRYRSAPLATDLQSGNALNLQFRELGQAVEYLGKTGESATPLPSVLVNQLTLRHAPTAFRFRLVDLEPGQLPQVLTSEVIRGTAEPFEAYVRELKRCPTTTVGELLRFMRAYHLQFSAAETAGQVEGHSTIYLGVKEIREASKPADNDEKQ
jgi:hypothetical protein